MNTRRSLLAMIAATGLAVAANTAGAFAPVGSEFTYQGELQDSGVVYDGIANFRFRLFNAAVGGSQVGSQDTHNGVTVTQGRFTVDLDFGNVFQGDDLWLEVLVDTGGGYIALSPRQPLNATPYAMYALSGPAPAWNDLTGVPAGFADGVDNNTTYTWNTLPGIPGDFADNVDNVSIETWATLAGIPAGFADGVDNNTTYTWNTLPGIPAGFADNVDNVSVETWATLSGIPAGFADGIDNDTNFWTQSGSNIYRSSGNVGILDSTPAADFTVGNGDKFQVSGIQGDVTFTDDLASITFAATDDTNSPMIQMFASGTTNGDRMVFAHSATFPTWGLQYRDSDDSFHFLRGGTSYFNVGSRIGVLTETPESTMDVNGTLTTNVLVIDGGADLSESFNVVSDVEPGMVVTIDPEAVGSLKISEGAYDRTVAGIVAGAGGVAPGMIMGQKDSIADGDHPVALTGRVYCYCDASSGSIRPGDLLTTSSIPGHAMKVTDHDAAQGAIIGKAMTSLDDGTGLVLVLVSLQ